jgi:hypothetical protein
VRQRREERTEAEIGASAHELHLDRSVLMAWIGVEDALRFGGAPIRVIGGEVLGHCAQVARPRGQLDARDDDREGGNKERHLIAVGTKDDSEGRT